MFVPEGLAEYVRDDHFRGLSASNQRRIVTMLWAWSMPRYQHKYNAVLASFHSSWLRGLWGNLEAMRSVLGSHYFNVAVGSNVNHYTHGYKPYRFLAEALIDFLLDDRPCTMRDPRGRAQERPREPFRSRAVTELDTDGKPPKFLKHAVWTGYRCAEAVPVDTEALLRFCTLTSDLRQQIAALWLRKLALLHHEAIPVSYQQVSTGRVFDVHWYLQCTPREVLSAALNAMWDYDLENAHYSIAYQWAQRLGLSAGAISEYLDNKSGIRLKLSRECGISIDAIKECLIGILYGAILHTDPRYSSIADLVGREAAQRFKDHPFVKGLADDVRRIRKPIVESLPKHAGRIGNAAGVYVREPSLGKALCHALQGVEVQALQAVVKAHGPDIVLLMHDGWVSRVQLDLRALERTIEDATGFALKVDQTQHPKHQPKDEPSGATDAASLKAVLMARFGEPPKPTRGIQLAGSPQWALPPSVKGQRMPKRKPNGGVL
jgi:predicted transcriptional regulator